MAKQTAPVFPLDAYDPSNWYDEVIRVKAIDWKNGQITLAAPSLYGVKSGRFYALNLLEELDAPGEFYIDAKNRRLYFWPPAPIEQARIVGRGLVSGLATMPNYRNSLLRMGFTDEELAGDVSDRAADAILAWGDEAAIRRRIQEHWDAGADQVAIQVMPKDGGLLTAEDERVLELLAPRG